ncbi:MAG: hypothetical protein B6I37_07295, partial [Desulfobacteraceae bacterium 4572_35.2]
MTAPQDDHKLLEILHRRNEELETLVQIGKTLTSTLDTEELSNRIIEKGNLLLKSRTWLLLLVDESNQELVFDVVVSDVIGNDLKGKRIPLNEGIAGWVANQRQAIHVADVSVDPRFSDHVDQLIGFKTSSMVCVPVQIQNHLLGVMQLVNGNGDDPFTDSDLALLSAIADYIAIGISNARNFSRVRELVITDDLTGLYNARYLDDLLDIEISRAERFSSNLALVFIDLDFFKLVNDKHGHL